MQGKYHQTGGATLRPSQRKAERAALRSQKKAKEREWRRENLGPDPREVWK